MKVYLVIYGDGCDGDEYRVDAVYATREAALREHRETYRVEIQEWEVKS